jgi:F420-0:gamma-glutamyl ligase
MAFEAGYEAAWVPWVDGADRAVADELVRAWVLRRAAETGSTPVLVTRQKNWIDSQDEPMQRFIRRGYHATVRGGGAPPTGPLLA